LKARLELVRNGRIRLQPSARAADSVTAGLADPNPAKILVAGVSKRFLQSKAKLFTREWTPGLEALRNINLRFPEFGFVSVLGPSGCGKTTLLRIVAGLIAPTTGTVVIDDKPVSRPRPDTGMVFQYIGLFPWRTIEENVFFSKELHLHRALQPHERDAARNFIKLVGLAGFEKSFPHQLSGGMQQRVGIARALAIEPDVLLMDEPFGALDAQTRLILQDELLRICATYKATVMFITHDIEEAIYLSDQIVVMSRRPGEIKFVVDVDLPKPRDAYDVRSSPEFVALRSSIWKALRDEIIEGGL
jgi:NitT/TauT family transport system ATP-binding protein